MNTVNTVKAIARSAPAAVTGAGVAPAFPGSLGTNADYSLDDKNILTIRIDLNKRLGASSTGKSIIVATTSGNKTIDRSGGVVIGINAYVKP